MLNFLEERNDFKPRNSFRSKPQIAFGISIDAPSTFRNEHSMVSPSSHRNPFFEGPQEGAKEASGSNYQSVSPSSWVHKTDINQVEVPLIAQRKRKSSEAVNLPLGQIDIMKPISRNFKKTVPVSSSTKDSLQTLSKK